MIEIIDFNDFLPPDVKRGRVKHPRWFRQRCNLSSEAQVLLQSEDGPALFGVWCLIQAWAMRHPRRGGRFVFSNGTPRFVHGYWNPRKGQSRLRNHKPSNEHGLGETVEF